MKNITTKQALALIKDGYKISVADGPVEPQAFLSELHTVLERDRGLSIWMCLTMRTYPFLQRPEYGNNIRINSIYMTKYTRDAYELLDTVSYVPTHLRRSAVTICAGGAPDLFVGSCTPPRNGKVSLGLSNIYSKEVIKRAKCVVMEINPNMPYTLGDTLIDIEDIDYCVDVDFPMVQDKPVPVNDKDKLIGGYISEYIKDGDCLQIGIGSIPNSVVQFLKTKKDLGIHTELLGDGVAELAMAGIVNGSRKSFHPGKIVTSIVLGSDKVYNFAADNENVLLLNCSECNAYETIAKTIIWSA